MNTEFFINSKLKRNWKSDPFTFEVDSAILRKHKANYAGFAYDNLAKCFLSRG